MKRFFTTLPHHLLLCVSGRRLIYHFAAILLTVVLVRSGFDWHYYLATRNPSLRAWMWPAAMIGMFLPVWLPLLLLVIGFIAKSSRTALTGWAIGQAEFLGWFISSAYKAFTGRVHPARDAGLDISHVFRFGFLRGGIFWGWPSSHTTIAFAMAATVVALYPRQSWLGLLAVLYAFYIGLGVSMTIHWYSDFVAGAILGSIIGTVVGKGFGFSTQVQSGQ